MRLPVLTMAAGALLCACSDETVAPPPKPPIGSLEPNVVPEAGADRVTAKERAIPDAYAKAVTSAPADGGAPFAAIAPLLSPDLVQFSSPVLSEAWKDKHKLHEAAGVVAAHEELFGGFDDRKLALSRVWRTPSEQSIEWTMTGTHARDWQGVAATRKPVAFKGLTLLWTKDDGTVTDVHVYFDAAVVKAQLGAAPKDMLPPPVPAPPAGAPQVLEQTESGSTDQKRNVAVVKGALDALENGNESAYLGSMTDDVEVDTVQSAQPLRGKAAMGAYFKTMRKAIGQLDTTVHDGWGIGSYAIVEYFIQGEQLAPIGWVPLVRQKGAAVGPSIQLDVVDVCEIKDGKIAHVWRYDDPGEILE